MTEWIYHATHTPPICFFDGGDLSSSRRKCLSEHRIRIRHRQDHPDRTTTQGLWTEVGMLGGLVTQPELCTVDGQPGHHGTAWILNTMDLVRAECRLVELNCSRAVSN